MANASEAELAHLFTNLAIIDEAGHEMVLDYLKNPYVNDDKVSAGCENIQSYELVMFTQKWGKFITS